MQGTSIIVQLYTGLLFVHISDPPYNPAIDELHTKL
jgi:hypothetical protein